MQAHQAIGDLVIAVAIALDATLLLPIQPIVTREDGHTHLLPSNFIVG